MAEEPSACVDVYCDVEVLELFYFFFLSRNGSEFFSESHLHQIMDSVKIQRFCGITPVLQWWEEGHVPLQHPLLALISARQPCFDKVETFHFSLQCSYYFSLGVFTITVMLILKLIKGSSTWYLDIIGEVRYFHAYELVSSKIFSS